MEFTKIQNSTGHMAIHSVVDILKGISTPNLHAWRGPRRRSPQPSFSVPEGSAPDRDSATQAMVLLDPDWRVKHENSWTPGTVWY